MSPLEIGKDGTFGYPLASIGILGGGQLAKMMAQVAKQYGFAIHILDPTPDAPASPIADTHTVGDLYDESSIRSVVERCDVTTYDIEHIDTVALKKLADEGYEIHPSPHLLEIIQDKFRQKESLSEHGIPVPRYVEVEKPDKQDFHDFGYPLVQKSRRGGYDGGGVQILESDSDFHQAIQSPSMIEDLIRFEKELSVLVARGHDGNVATYPVVEMVFNPEGNLLELLLAPARISDEIASKAESIAIKAVNSLDGVGIFGVELFLTKDGEVLLNEIAPRPHNSGHFTIEACVTDQFEQHLRAITGLPLGSTELLKPAVMVNLLGAPAFEGPPLISGLREILELPGVSFHFYGKNVTRPMRKMGHVTILNDQIERGIELGKTVLSTLRIQSKEEA